MGHRAAGLTGEVVAEAIAALAERAVPGRFIHQNIGLRALARLDTYVNVN